MHTSITKNPPSTTAWMGISGVKGGFQVTGWFYSLRLPETEISTGALSLPSASTALTTSLTVAF